MPSPTTPSVVVIGGVCMDLHAQAATDVVPGSSNPGSSQLSPGGVARNIAEVLARLGTASHLVSVVGDDPLGSELIAHTEEAGVDVTHVRHQSVRTGTYAAILAPSGELLMAVADMGAADLISPLQVEAAAPLIRAARMVLLDGNLPSATLEHAVAVAREAGVMIALDPVSVPKAEWLRPVLSRGITMLAANRAELAALTGQPTRTAEQVDAAIERLHELGVPQVWVRLGSEGSVLDCPEGRWEFAEPGSGAVDLTGADDAMLGAYCHALVRGDEPEAAARYGHAAAELTRNSRSTVRIDLSDALIRSTLEG